MNQLYLEDLHIGQRFTSGTHVMEEASIKEFAADFDPQPFHLDANAARSSVFKGLAASGWHTAAIAMRLLVSGAFRLRTALSVWAATSLGRGRRALAIFSASKAKSSTSPHRDHQTEPGRDCCSQHDAESERRTRVCSKRQAACVQTPIGISSSVAKSLR